MVRSPRRRRRLGGKVINWKAGSCTPSRVASSPLEICVRDGAPDRREDPATSSETRVGRDRACLTCPDAAARVALRLRVERVEPAEQQRLLLLDQLAQHLRRRADLRIVLAGAATSPTTWWLPLLLPRAPALLSSHGNRLAPRHLDEDNDEKEEKENDDGSLAPLGMPLQVCKQLCAGSRDFRTGTRRAIQGQLCWRWVPARTPCSPTCPENMVVFY